MHVLVVKNRLHRKILVSAIKTLLEYYEASGETSGSVRGIADAVGKAHGTVKRYLWELTRQGLVHKENGRYVFEPDRLREALKALGATAVPTIRTDRIRELALDDTKLAETIEKIRADIEKLKKEVSIMKVKIQHGKKECRHEKLLKELDEWSKDMDKWADNVDKKLEDLEQRIKNLTNLVLRLLDKVKEK